VTGPAGPKEVRTVRITPIDIRKQEFRRTLRGLDADEVETFLAMVADEMERLIGESQQARTESGSLKERLAEYQQMESTMRETLVTVQKAAEQKRDAARQEADMILKEAEVRASQWIEEAHRSIREVKRELAKLRGMRDAYVSRLRLLVQAQLDMLKMIEVEEETPDETLDLFEERLEALTRQARARIEETGEGAGGGTGEGGGILIEDEGPTAIQSEDLESGADPAEAADVDLPLEEDLER
jgi:cell division initiation protein